MSACSDGRKRVAFQTKLWREPQSPRPALGIAREDAVLELAVDDAFYRSASVGTSCFEARTGIELGGGDLGAVDDEDQADQIVSAGRARKNDQ